MKQLWLGRYISGHSFYHSLDPRAKLLVMLINILMMFLITTWWQLAVVLLFTMISLFLSQIPFAFYVKQAMFFKYMYAFFIIFFAFTNESNFLFHHGWLHISVDGLGLGFFYSLKMILFVWMGALLTFTTTPSELILGAKMLIKRVSVEQFMLMITLSIRLIPMILDEVSQIYKAQQSRGLDFTTLPLKEKLAGLMAIIIPAISNTVHRLTIMMDVMECRGYIVGNDRTSIHQLKWKLKDTIILGSSLIVCFSILFIK